jgi:hypothetical protein
MNLSSQQSTSLNNHLENHFLTLKVTENKLALLFYTSLKSGTSTTPLYEWTEKVQNEIDELENLVYNNHYQGSTLYQSVVSKILTYDKIILTIEKKIRVHELVWSKEQELYRKRLNKIQQRIQIVLLYLHV